MDYQWGREGLLSYLPIIHCILFTDEHFVPTYLTILQFYNSNKNMGIKESLEQIHNSVRTIVYSRAQLRSYIYL